ncbi:MAG: hypothetical protein ACLP5H_04945 [Desulfomonilaceae bacterium]
MINVNRYLGGFALGTVPRKERQHLVYSDLSHITSVAENLETELAAIKEEIAHIEGRLKNVAENWDSGRSGSPS